MDQIKQNLFWIILGVVLVAALGIYFSQAPNVDDSKTQATGKTEELRKAADNARSTANPDALLTDRHTAAASAFVSAAAAERAAELAMWKDKQLELRFKDIPDAKKDSIEFDKWLDALREKLAEKLKTANIKPPEAFDKLTFRESGVDDRMADLHRHRDYRLRYMSIFDEVVDALASKPGSQEVRTFETDPAKSEVAQNVPVGPIALNNFVFHTPEETAKIKEKEYAHAMTMAGRALPSAGGNEFKPYDGPTMPVKVCSFDVEFTTHISALAPIVRKLEASSRYFAVVTHQDFERAYAPPYPGPMSDTKYQTDFAKAQFNPLINSHYGEGPIRAFVSFDIYEFDETAAKKLESNQTPVVPPKNKNDKGPKHVAKP